MPDYVDRSQPRIGQNDVHSSQTSPDGVNTIKRRSGARREWDAAAARIAARAANARVASRRSSGSSSPNRVEKPAVRRHRPGLSIDTNVAQIRRSPQELFPRGTRRHQATGYTKLNENASLLKPFSNNSQSLPATAPPPYTDEARSNNLVSKFSPETPTILITPAIDGRITSEQPKRIASSIYSRMTTGATPPVQPGDVPPLPSDMARYIKGPQPHTKSDLSTAYHASGNTRESNATAFEEDFDEKKIGRVTSTGTLFEEDHVPLYSPSRVGFGNELTIDTAILPTPRRSRGWWDLIRTPFDNAKSFSRFGKSPTDGEITPEVPTIPAPYYSQTLPSNGLGLRVMPRATHNSQALRRLESNDQLRPAVPTLPAELRVSGYSTLSPADRDVPLMLSISPSDAGGPTTQARQRDLSASTIVGSASAFKPSPNANETPDSVRSAFSPAGQITSVGAVTTAKGVVKNPLQTSTQYSNQVPLLSISRTTTPSLRNSFTAEVVKRTPIPATAPTFWIRPESTWPTASSTPPQYFAPPPISMRAQSRDRSRDNNASPGAFPTAHFSQFTSNSKEKRRTIRRFLQRKGGKPDEKNPKKTKRRRWCCLCCCFVLFILVLLAVILGVVLSRAHHKGSTLNAPPQPIFLNLTNYPPIPTGILTVAQPNLRTSVSGCVNPQAMWSCAVPKEQQADLKPNDPDQPNFVFDIRYVNDSSTTKRFRRARLESPAASTWNTHMLQGRDGTVLQASPKPPSLEEYAFLGNTTDAVMEPFEGESTPFYISFKPPSQANFKKAKRHDDGSVSNSFQNGSAASSSSPPDGFAATTSVLADSAASTIIEASASTAVNFVPDLATAIPKPAVNSDGTAQAANLVPFPSFQPLRLFNRGQPDEHYGFYTYFERSIFLRSVSFQNITEEMIGDIPSDADGGATEDAATARCTWTDTRFKVQIWTNKAESAQILPGPAGTSAPRAGSTTFVRPGSFPYPITLTLDRHGGGLTTKMLYCYGMDAREIQDTNSKKFQPEMRNFGGQLVNPALGPFTNVSVSVADGGPGGIDGGTGGCLCEWANWLTK